MFAQDSQRRHVAIKLIPNKTDELHILKFLGRQSLETLKDNCIAPILEFLSIDGSNCCFVVMPRWGTDIHLPPPNTLRDVLQIIHSMLKGLAFLHRNNVLHRDTSMTNVLVNHFSSDIPSNNNPIRVKLRDSGHLLYALFDFDISIIVPADIKREEYRLPYTMSWWGWTRPYDTAQGEFDYDPFSFDVGCLGRVFCTPYQATGFANACTLSRSHGGPAIYLSTSPPARHSHSSRIGSRNLARRTSSDLTIRQIMHYTGLMTNMTDGNMYLLSLRGGGPYIESRPSLL
ncbi:unnamed protein product [Cyclocybe aegerita]|uniref:Protein kinase domain-containing protein n=1 Tax=Cyclocybe aegerita TaxID=1973307 RepID=A0A8S0WQS1_CYCAE|nr:unnamed protein product [Cyclocybe aegerita]